MSILLRRRALLLLSGAFLPTATSFISADTSVQPLSGNAAFPNSAYVASLGKTFITWERVPSPHESSVAAIISYDHALNEWSSVYDVGVWSKPDDAHGEPVIVYGPDSHFYCLFASHITPQYMASSTNANDITKWNAATTFGTAYTYPHPVVVGSEIHCFWRNGSGVNRTLIHRKGTPTAGSLTFGAETTIVDLNGGAGNFVYATEFHKVGTAIHFTFVQSDNTGTNRKHLYYAIYETTTGALSNIDGSTVVASGSLPINLTTANANFRIFENTGSNVGTLSSFQFDTSGNAHVTYADGVPDSLGRMQAYSMYWNGSAWSTPVAIAMVEEFAYVALVPGLSGAMEAWYHQDDGDAYLYGGSTMCRRVWNGSTWATQEVMATASGSYPLNFPAGVRDAHPDIRVIFTEIIPSFDYTVADFLKRYAHGDSGWAVGPDPAVLQYAADAATDVLHVAVNDNSRIIDYTGNNTSTNATVSGTEIVFNGTSARYVLTDSAPYTQAADWTLQFDGVKFAANTGLQTLIGHQNGGVGGVKSWRVLYNGSNISLQGDIGAGLANILVYVWVPVVGQYYDIAYERSGNTVYLYIDDLTAGNHVASAALSSAFVATTNPLAIGAEYNTSVGGNYQRFFNGNMSKVRLAPSALIS